MLLFVIKREPSVKVYLGKIGSAHASMRLVCQWGQGQGQGFLVVGSGVKGQGHSRCHVVTK
jgi:hypothetical protein